MVEGRAAQGRGNSSQVGFCHKKVAREADWVVGLQHLNNNKYLLTPHSSSATLSLKQINLIAKWLKVTQMCWLYSLARPDLVNDILTSPQTSPPGNYLGCRGRQNVKMLVPTLPPVPPVPALNVLLLTQSQFRKPILVLLNNKELDINHQPPPRFITTNWEKLFTFQLSSQRGFLKLVGQVIQALDLDIFG